MPPEVMGLWHNYFELKAFEILKSHICPKQGCLKKKSNKFRGHKCAPRTTLIRLREEKPHSQMNLVPGVMTLVYFLRVHSSLQKPICFSISSLLLPLSSPKWVFRPKFQVVLQVTQVYIRYTC